MFDLAKKNIIRVKNLEVRIIRKVKNTVKLNYDKCIKKIKGKNDTDLESKGENVNKDIEKVINSPLRIYDKRTQNIKEEIDEENLEKDKVVLYLLFKDVNKFDIEEVKERIESISHENIEFDDIFKNHDTSKIYGDIFIEKEKVKLIGYDFPVEKEINEMTIKFAQGSQEEIENIQNHNYYIAAYYEGKSKDYNSIYNIYAKLAYGFIDDSFVGMANKYCYNVLPPNLIRSLFEDEKIFEYASTPVMAIWRNLIRIPYEDKIWYVTKGNNIYGTHEFAFKGESSESDSVSKIFNFLFNYEYISKMNIEPGFKLRMQKNIELTFKYVYELPERLESEGKGTLVVEKII